MLASNFIKPDIKVHLQSENGILGLVSIAQNQTFPFATLKTVPQFYLYADCCTIMLLLVTQLFATFHK